MESKTYKQERPNWCPHKDCIFKRRAIDDICGGDLPKEQCGITSDGHQNNHRFCLNHVLPKNEIFDLQVNDNDLQWFRWIFDSLDGKETSWLSKGRRK